MLGSVWDGEQSTGFGGRDGEGGPRGAGEGCVSGIKASLEAGEFLRTGVKVKSLGSRYSLSRGEEATRGNLVAADFGVKRLGGWWSFAASDADTSAESSLLKSWQKLMVSVSFPNMLQETGHKAAAWSTWDQGGWADRAGKTTRSSSQPQCHTLICTRPCYLKQ